MRSFFKNTPAFVVFYLLLMIPTYILPYFGSNSTMVNGAGILTGFFNPFLILHVLLFVGLMMVTWFRGAAIDKKWLIIFPILAMLFDLLPFLNFIPLVPTIMHLFAIILGVIQSTQSATAQTS